MSEDSGSSFMATFTGALEGSISVLLTLLAGYIVARRGMVDRSSVHKVSNLCSKLFLPMLIITEMGPELTVSQLKRLWILPVWGLVSTLIAHLIGWIGCKIFKTRSWVIVACGRPNSSALPLLLLKALSSTGVLSQFSSGDEDADKLLKRAQSLILLNVVVQQTFTFQTGPWLIRQDAKADGKRLDEEDAPARLTPSSPGMHASNINPIVQDSERIGLLSDQDGRSYGTQEGREGTNYSHAVEPIADHPDIHWPHAIAFLEKPMKKTWKVMSPPLLGAIVALFIGVRTGCCKVSGVVDVFLPSSFPHFTPRFSTKKAISTAPLPRQRTTLESSCTFTGVSIYLMAVVLIHAIAFPSRCSLSAPNLRWYRTLTQALFPPPSLSSSGSSPCLVSACFSCILLLDGDGIPTINLFGAFFLWPFLIER